MQKITILLFALLALQSCGEEEKQDLTQNVNKEGAVETQISIEHIDNQSDVLITTSKIWVKNSLFKEIVNRDTVPSLGDFSETNENGQQVQGKKDYELYITVK
jgi:hypothetical protein